MSINRTKSNAGKRLFGKQDSIIPGIMESLSEAVIMVDNAGITKNISILVRTDQKTQ